MDAKRLLVGTLNGTVGALVTAFLIWEVLLADYFSGQMPGVEALDSPDMVLQVLAAAVHALLITILLGWKQPTSGSEAMKAGALVGGLLWAGVNLWNTGAYGMWTLQGALVDALMSTLPFAVAAFAVYWTTMRGELQSGRLITADGARERLGDSAISEAEGNTYDA